MGASTADVYTIVADQYRQIERLTNEMRICKELAEAAIDELRELSAQVAEMNEMKVQDAIIAACDGLRRGVREHDAE